MSTPSHLPPPGSRISTNEIVAWWATLIAIVAAIVLATPLAPGRAGAWAAARGLRFRLKVRPTIVALGLVVALLLVSIPLERRIGDALGAIVASYLALMFLAGGLWGLADALRQIPFLPGWARRRLPGGRPGPPRPGRAL